MILGNVNIGAFANSGTGDPLRNAFDLINQNFANVAAASSIPPAGVTTVAGRSGNVILVASDVIGVASTAYVNSAVAAVNVAIATTNASIAATQNYTMARPQDWQPIGNVYTIADAIDQLAFRLKQAGY